MNKVKGIAVSPGYAVGRVFVYRPPTLDKVPPPDLFESDPAHEQARFRQALQYAEKDLDLAREQARLDIGVGAAAIFDAHLAFLRDPVLAANIGKRLEQKTLHAEHALAAELQDLVNRFNAISDEYLHERAMDFRDIGNRIFRYLVQESGQSPLSRLPPDTIVVTQELLPSDTIALDRQNVIGLATAIGGATSHVGILARAMGLPGVTGLNGMLPSVQSGSPAIIDGVKGLLLLDPTEKQQHRFRIRCRRYEEAMHAVLLEEKQECRMTDGRHVAIRSNVNSRDEVEHIREHSFDGIGLYRTELLYLHEAAAPDVDRQFQAYTHLAAAVAPRPAVIRTFDFGLDKLPSFLDVKPSDLDRGGLCFALRERRLFRTQLRALVRAYGRCDNLRILFPMVMGAQPLRDAIALLHHIGKQEGVARLPPIGAMIETPAAVFAIKDIVELVQFVSIGCNDLAQYTLALGRRVSDLDIREWALDPALLHAISLVTEAASSRKCPVCICGEAASDVLVAAIFVGLGIRELSVTPVRAPMVRCVLRHLDTRVTSKLASAAQSGERVPKLIARLNKHLPKELHQA